MTSDNPYAPPASEVRASVVDQPESLMAIARRVFLAWEKLRIAFVAILGAVTVLILGKKLLEPDVVFSVFGYAVVANVCFFAGPIVETYVNWLGCRHGHVRWSLFIAGTMFSLVLTVGALTVGALAENLLPDQF